MKIKLDIQKFASGTINFPNNGSMYGKIEWSSTVVGSTDTEKAINNKSSVTAILYVKRNDAYTTLGTFSGGITINNNTSSTFYTYLNVGNNWYEVGRYTIEVPHNSDGTKLINILGWITGPTETSWGGKTVNGIGTVALDTIQRMSSLISFTNLGDNQGRNNVEGTFKAEYTRYNPNFTDDLVLEYMDRSVDPATWTTFKTITNYISGATFTFNSTELQTLYDGSPTIPLVNIRVYLKTYSGQTLIGESTRSLITCRIYDAEPIFSDFAFADINSTTLALTGSSSINVNNYSNIQITISTSNKATAQKGATMVKYKVNIGDKTIDIAYSDSASVSGVINGSPNGTYQVYAIDSRGTSTLVTKFATSQKEYTNITRDTNYSATRDDGGIGSNVSISFSGSIWNGNFGSVNNGFTTAKYLLKKTDSSTWIDLGASMTNITPTITDNTYSFTGLIRSDNADTKWDLDSSYDIKIILEDKLSSVEFIMTVASATPNISLSKNGVGIMCDYDETLGGLLQVGGEPYGAGAVGSVTMYAGDTAPTGYLLCDGTAISRTTYSDLFSVIGTTYGTGDGSTTFNLPNLKGKVVVGLDSSDNDFDSLGETGGSKNLQAHTHKISNAGYEGGSSGDALVFKSRLTVVANYMETASTGTGNSGNLQPYMVMNYIIKY